MSRANHLSDRYTCPVIRGEPLGDGKKAVSSDAGTVVSPKRLVEMIGRITPLIQIRLTSEFITLGRKILTVTLVSVLVVGLQGVILWLLEQSTNSRVQNPLDGIYITLVAIFGETGGPETIGARIVTIVALIEGLFLGAYIVVVAAVFNLRGGGIFMRKFSNHIVICGWNFQGAWIIHELLEGSDDDIVVIPGDEKPNSGDVSSPRVRVVEGQPTEDTTLDEAGISEARSAIILTDPRLRPTEADAKTLMVGLAVESKNRSVYSCAQIMDSANEVHLQRANVDEVILLDTIGANLAVASAVNPGVTLVVNELVTFNEGCEFYRIQPPPDSLLGMSFSQASLECRDQRAILIAVETNDATLLPADLTNSERVRLTDHISQYGRAILVNPEGYSITAADSLFFIADERPVFTN